MSDSNHLPLSQLSLTLQPNSRNNCRSCAARSILKSRCCCFCVALQALSSKFERRSVFSCGYKKKKKIAGVYSTPSLPALLCYLAVAAALPPAANANVIVCLTILFEFVFLINNVLNNLTWPFDNNIHVLVIGYLQASAYLVYCAFC